MLLTFAAWIVLSSGGLHPTGRAIDAYGKLPLSFEANEGQMDPSVKFFARGPGYGVALTRDAAILTIANRGNNTALRITMPGAKTTPEIEGREELPGKSNYFIGNDPSKWRTNVRTYSKVAYRAVHPGIDLVYYGNGQQLEYDFVIAPGADPNAIRLHVDGAEKLEIGETGDLIVHTGETEIRWRKPAIYQKAAGVNQPVNGHYVVRQSEVSFHVDRYDASRTLVIDPVLVYSTYLGGRLGDIAFAVAVDHAGNVYVAGTTSSDDFPTANGIKAKTPGLTTTTSFVSKINAAGSAIVYSTYLDGTPGLFGGQANAIAVDSSGNLYVTGNTSSTNFPTVNAFQSKYSGSSDLFNGYVAKLSADGSALLYSTYIGATPAGQPAGIALDASGSAYITGSTTSKNFPTTPGSYRPTYAGLQEAFVTKLSPDGSTLVYSTFISGGNPDAVFFGVPLYADNPAGIAVDAAGNAYVTGLMTGVAVTNSIQSTKGMGIRVTKLNPTGSALVYSTSIGDSSGLLLPRGIALDTSGNAYVTGICGGSAGAGGCASLPAINAFQSQVHGSTNGSFVLKLNVSGSALVYSTFLGGSKADQTYGIAVDSSGDAYVAGVALSSDFPTKNQLAVAPGSIFVTEFDPTGSALIYSTTIDGVGGFPYAIALDASGNAYLAGTANGIAAIGTVPAHYMVQVNPLQPSFAGNGDAFVMKIGAGASGTPPAISTGGIVNGASFSKLPPAAGSIVSLFGSNLAPSTAAATTLPLPTILGGVSVTVNGVAAPLFFVSAGQINFQIPWEVASSSTVSVVVTVNGSASNSASLTLASAGPGIFTINSAGQGAIQIANTSTFAAPSGSIAGVSAQPVARGQFITVYCSGLGAVQSPPASGAAATGQVTVAAPTMAIGGVGVTPSFAGLSPGFVGLYQVNAQIPQNVTPGSAVAVVITVNGVASNSVTIAVQ